MRCDRAASSRADGAQLVAPAVWSNGGPSDPDHAGPAVKSGVGGPRDDDRGSQPRRANEDLRAEVAALVAGLTQQQPRADPGEGWNMLSHLARDHLGWIRRDLERA